MSQQGFIPQDGRGLNPSLQNFWMIIHPPVLFIGFASLAVPFVLAVAALWQKKYNEWIQAALPWVLFQCALAWCWSYARWLLGVWCAWLGWMVGMGSGGKFFAHSLDRCDYSCSYDADSDVDRQACTNKFYSCSAGVSCWLSTAHF